MKIESAAKKYALGILLIMVMQSILLRVVWAEEKVVHGNEIVNVYLHAYKSLGGINSYVIFRDKDGRQCATTGRLAISRKYAKYSKKSTFAGYQGIVDGYSQEMKMEHLKNIDFSPSDFQYMTLLNKQEIFALPITLSPDKVKEGDRIILEWRTFKIEKEVYGS